MTIFQKGGSTHAPLTLLLTRVVLPHKAYGVSNPLIPQLYVLYKAAFRPSSTPRMSYGTENFHAAREIVLYLKMQILFKLSY